MKKQIITLALSLIIGFTIADNNKTKTDASVTSSAQIISVSGSVSDYTSGESLAGVEIKIEGTNLKTYTDFDGNFEFKNLKPGTYNIIASYISYNKSLVENFNADNKNSTVSIKLQAAK